MGKSDEKQSVTSVTGVFRVVMRPISCKVEGGERWKQHRLYGISLKPRPVQCQEIPREMIPSGAKSTTDRYLAMLRTQCRSRKHVRYCKQKSLLWTGILYGVWRQYAGQMIPYGVQSTTDR